MNCPNTVKFRIDIKENRDAIVKAFADEGYKVRCFDREIPNEDSVYKVFRYVEIEVKP